MPKSKLTEFLDSLRKSWAAQAARDLTDRQLLDRFLADREDAAFTVLVQRHGPMVSSVCHRVLRDADAAEDAFQATFMVLFRRAASIRVGAPLGNWLYGVAQRIALRARTQDSSRRRHERRLPCLTSEQHLDELTWQELRTVLDEEIGRLPEKCRAPIVLCYFQGKSREGAAEELGWPKSSLNRRLAKAQDLLRGQLIRRGFALSAAAVATALGEKANSAPLSTVVVLNTVKAVTSAAAGKAAASAFLSARAIILAEEAMSRTLGLAVKLVLLFAVLGVGLGGGLYWANQPAKQQKQAKEEKTVEGEPDLSRARIEGVVVDEAGKPVAGVVVGVLPPWFTVDRIPVRTGADGSYRLVLQEASARYHVVLASAEEGARQGLLEFHDTALPQVVQARIVLKPSRKMTVRVTDGGKQPIENAAVGLFSGTTLLGQGQTDFRGAVSLRFPVDAKLQQVVALKPKVGFDYYENYLSTTGPIGEPPAEVGLTLNGAISVSIKALDSAEKTVAGVELIPWTLQKPGKLSSVNLSSAADMKYVAATTNGSGLATFDWIPPQLNQGTTFLNRNKEYNLPDPPHWDPTTKSEPLVARVFRNVPIGGKLTLPDGKPAGGILLQVEGHSPDTSHYFRSVVRTRADGTYSLLAYPNYSYIIAVTDEHWAAASKTGIAINEGKPRTNLDFTLNKGTILRGTVTAGKDNTPVTKQTINVHVLDPDSGGPNHLVRWTQTDNDGKYAIRVGSGLFQVGIPAKLKMEELTVKAEETITKNFHLERAASKGTFKGIVVANSPDGKPVPGAVVQARGGTGHFDAVTDDKGRFEARRLPDKGMVLARNPEKTLAAIVDVDPSDDEVKIILGPVRKVQGRILDKSGKPLAGIHVEGHLSYDGFTSNFGGGMAQTDEAGKYLITGMVSGKEYMVMAQTSESSYKRIQTLAAGTTELTDIGDFAMSPPRVEPKQDLKKTAPQKKNRAPALSPADHIAAIAKEHEELEKKFDDDLTAAKHDDDKVSEANQEYSDAVRVLADELRALARQLGKDPLAFESLLVLVCQLRYPLDDDLARLVVLHHGANAKMGQLCYELRYRGRESWASKILLAAADKHPDNAVRGIAVYSLGIQHRYRADDNQREKLSEAEKTKELAEAARCFTEVTKTFADVLTPDGSAKLGDKAASELTRINNLPNLKVGKMAPEITGEDLAGKPLKLSDYRGKVVLVVFWGTWCGPCMREVPHEQALFKQHAGKPFVILGVNSDKDRVAVQKVCVEKEITWRSWWDGTTSGPIATGYNVQEWPTVYVIDEEGVIRFVNPHGEKLDAAVAELLAKVNAPK